MKLIELKRGDTVIRVPEHRVDAMQEKGWTLANDAAPESEVDDSHEEDYN